MELDGTRRLMTLVLKNWRPISERCLHPRDRSADFSSRTEMQTVRLRLECLTVGKDGRVRYDWFPNTNR